MAALLRPHRPAVLYDAPALAGSLHGKLRDELQHHPPVGSPYWRIVRCATVCMLYKMQCRLVKNSQSNRSAQHYVPHASYSALYHCVRTYQLPVWFMPLVWCTSYPIGGIPGILVTFQPDINRRDAVLPYLARPPAVSHCLPTPITLPHLPHCLCFLAADWRPTSFGMWPNFSPTSCTRMLCRGRAWSPSASARTPRLLPVGSSSRFLYWCDTMRCDVIVPHRQFLH